MPQSLAHDFLKSFGQLRVLTGAERDAACRVGYGLRTFATPGEARAAECGFVDFPLFNEASNADPAYRTGWLDAELQAQTREDMRRETADAERDK